MMDMMKRTVLLAIGTLIFTLARAQEVGPASGSLILAGGGRVDNGIFQRFVELAGGKDARLVMIPTAGSKADYDETGPFFFLYPSQRYDMKVRRVIRRRE